MKPEYENVQRNISKRLNERKSSISSQDYQYLWDETHKLYYLAKDMGEKLENKKTEGYCANCRFWKKCDDNSGECHRKAPLPYISRHEEETKNIGTRWPFTNKQQSCGEFEGKK